MDTEVRLNRWRWLLFSLVVAMACACVLTAGVVACSPVAVKPLPWPETYVPPDGAPTERLDIQGPLTQYLRVREEAPTFEQLVAKTHPTFVWPAAECDRYEGGPHMLWVEKDAKGKTFIRLDHAFRWKPAEGQPARWVLIEKTPVRDDATTQAAPDRASADAYAEIVSNALLGVRIPLGRKKVLQGDGNFADNYAARIADSDDGGSVYEVGWKPEDNAGNYRYQPVVYLWRDTAGKWRLLGDGPKVSMDRMGWDEWLRSTLRTKVRWSGKPVRPVLEFVFLFEQSGLFDESTPRPELVTCTDYVLAAGLDGPGQLRKTTERPYLVVAKGDTAEKIIERYSVWSPRWHTGVVNADKERDHARIRQTWREYLLRTNPAFRARPLEVGTRIVLPTYAERDQVETELLKK